MTVASCPECRDEVRLPSGLSAQAIIRCPLCGEEYSAEALIRGLPPMVQVISDPGGAPLISTGSSHVFDDDDGIIEIIPARNAEPARATEDPEDQEVPAFDFEESSAPQREPPEFVSTAARSSRRRARRSRPLAQMVGVVLGGFAAIPLAQICLWWAFKVDPVEAGPKVARYLPFAVPKQFHGVESDDQGSLSAQLNEEPPDRQPRGRRLLDADDPNPFRDYGGNGRRNGEGSANGNGGRTPGPDAGGEGPNEPPIEPPDGISPGDGSAGASSPSDDLRNISQSSAEDVLRAVQLVVDGHQTWLNLERIPEADRPAFLDEFFQSLCDLGECLLFVDPKDVASVAAAYEMDIALREAFLDSRLQKFVSNRALRMMEQPAELIGRGLVISGELISSQRRGRFIENRMRLDDLDKSEVVFYGWLTPPATFVPGCRITVFAGRVQSPREVLGISVDAPEAICGGYVMILQPPGAPTGGTGTP